MSRIKDLEIRGIRNFGDESAKARIHFSKPLTLILGPNGTGKTTIIESLKYVTSGEYPPDSDKGKAFVHEPKLTQNHTVRGQVKARIIDKKGHELIITRTMQVARQKSGTLKFQSLDNVITQMDQTTKKKVQISSRCADIDREMLIAMGVSKPILNYVIFCHQEESNWPLEDGKKLKDRFDEIFDTSKYNKAMDTNTKLIKDLVSELNTIKAREEGLRQIVDEVEDQEEKLKESEVREQEARNRITEIDQSIIPIDQRMGEILEVKKEYLKLEEKLNRVETDYKLTKNHVDSLRKHIKELHKGTKEELIEIIDTYDQNLTQKFTNKKEYENKLTAAEKQENISLKELADARIQLGSLTQRKIALDEKVTRRNELLTTSLKTWNMQSNDSTFTEEEVKEYLEQIERKFQEFTVSMKNKIRENEQEERYVQKEVDTSRAEKTGIDSEMSLKKNEIKEIQAEINILRKRINEAGEAGNKLDIVESDLKNASQKYDALIESFDETSIKENLQKETAKKKEINDKLNHIDHEINSLHQLSSQQAELELHQSRLKEKEKNILALKEKHQNNLESLFENIPQRKLKDNLEKMQKLLSIEKTNLTNQIEQEQKKLTTLQTTLKYKEAELSKTISELEGYKKRVQSECQDDDYDEILLLQERKVKSLQDQRGIYANQSLMYEEYIKQIKKKSCCPLCERGFQNSSEAKQLEQKLYVDIKKNPQSLKECEKELKKEQARYDALQQLKPITQQITDIEDNKLPKMRTTVQEIKTKLEKSEQNLETLKLSLCEPEEKLNIYKSIVGDIILLDSYINEKDNLVDMIESKTQDIHRAGKIGVRSMQEAQNERQALKKRQSNIESNIEKIQSTLQAGQEKIQLAREKKNKLNEEVLRLRQTMQDEKQLKDKVTELLDKESSLDKSLRSLRHKLVIAEDELSKKIDELNDLKKKNRDEQDKNLNFKSKATTEVHELKTVQHEVERYINSKIEQKLKAVEFEVEKLKNKCDEKKTEKLDLEESIRFLDEQCRSQESGKKELENNLEYITKQEDVIKLNSQVTKYRSALENLEYDKLKREYQKLQDDRESFEREKNLIKGAQAELESSIKQRKKNLNQEKYRMARYNHSEKQLELVVQEEAIANLKAYVTVLDKAMIQFHEERMNTVNKIMHQLWTLVYGGNDTSSIQIRVQTTEGIGDKKRTYNYKLVQVKRSTEMDMKGKCSAGQKVLASIIIRMALAETFCNDCAVLALDEPTTNLDEENATNLAVTLSKVIQLRAQHHKNFQLIVISHDEKFISHLSNLSGKQVFQELYRNIDGYSLVRRRDMSDFIKNNSQSVSDVKFEEDSDEEENEERAENDERDEFRRSTKKRDLSIEDSPPHSRSSRKRVCL